MFGQSAASVALLAFLPALGRCDYSTNSLPSELTTLTTYLVTKPIPVSTSSPSTVTEYMTYEASTASPKPSSAYPVTTLVIYSTADHSSSTAPTSAYQHLPPSRYTSATMSINSTHSTASSMTTYAAGNSSSTSPAASSYSSYSTNSQSTYSTPKSNSTLASTSTYGMPTTSPSTPDNDLDNYEPGTCSLHLVQTQTCEDMGSNMYADIVMYDNRGSNASAIGRTSQNGQTIPFGFPINANNSYSFKTKLKNPMIIVGEHEGDYVQFTINGHGFKSNDGTCGDDAKGNIWNPHKPNCNDDDRKSPLALTSHRQQRILDCGWPCPPGT